MHVSVVCLALLIEANANAVFSKIYYELGMNLGDHVRERILRYLRQTRTEIIPLENLSKDINSATTLIMSLGNASLSSKHIDIKSDKPESYRILLNRYKRNGAYAVYSDGRVLDDHTHKNISFNRESVHYGAVLSAYATLELLGFSFLHPMQAYVPALLYIENTSMPQSMYESPYWPERNWHLHTQHPLELTEVLQGFDIPHFGSHGVHCKSNVLESGSYCERWEDMIADVDSMFEWAVANRLNKIEWLLLGHRLWGDELETRWHRLSVLTDLGHRYSLMIGADCPLGNIQQHGWSIISTRLPFTKQMQQIKDRVDWIFSAGFDFISTESGMSEFTHPECSLMLDMLNYFAEYSNHSWGREAGVKVHCSTGQSCHDYMDPRTNEPVNFNFLTMFAVPELGVFPHTVQTYGFSDPAAGAYGNDDFTAIEEYLVYESKLGNRSVSYYGETSYWVNVDIDVPLFLPITPQRRLQDLRTIAKREINENFRMHGQMNFDSGWEWGYWLNDLVTARASWNPHMDLPDEWDAFRSSLAPITRIFGPIHGSSLQDVLVELSRAQETLLIMGMVNGKPCPDIKKLSGFAYVSGVDTWVDVPRMFGLSMTQPDKIHMHETGHPLWKHVLPLLIEMESIFGNISTRITAVHRSFESSIGFDCEGGSSQGICRNKNSRDGSRKGPNVIGDRADDLIREIVDCITILYLRARQVRLLYESKDSATSAQKRLDLLYESRAVLSDADRIVKRREDFYRVPLQRVASWRENPTVYRYGYLWSVHSLYYWWRDQGLAEQGNMHVDVSPCYLNRMDVTEVAVGWGKYTLEIIRGFINKYSPFSAGYPLEVVNCIAPPSKPYTFPKDLFPFR